MSWNIGGETFAASARATGGRGFRVTLGERTVDVAARVERDGVLVVTLPDGRSLRAATSRGAQQRWLSVGGETWLATWATRAKAVADHQGGLEAPMPGKIVRVAVAVGDAVAKGQVVVTLEAMKMEHALKAPRDGVVREVNCRVGELVQPGAALVVLEAKA